MLSPAAWFLTLLVLLLAGSRLDAAPTDYPSGAADSDPIAERVEATGPGLAEAVSVVRLDTLASRPGEGKEAFLRRVGAVLAAFTARTGFEGCGLVWAQADGSAWTVPLTSNRSHCGCLVTTLPVGNAGEDWQRTPDTIHSHPTAPTYVVNRADRLFLHEAAGVGETWHQEEPGTFSALDLQGGPGYLAARGRLLYQHGPDSIRDVGALPAL